MSRTVRGLPSEVLLEPGVDPVPGPCAVNLDSVECVSVGVLVDRLGRLSDQRMREVCDALSVAVDLPAAVRHRCHLDDGGPVDVIDLGFGVLTVPAGGAARLLDEVLPAEAHYAAVAAEDDPDLVTT